MSNTHTDILYELARARACIKTASVRVLRGRAMVAISIAIADAPALASMALTSASSEVQQWMLQHGVFHQAHVATKCPAAARNHGRVSKAAKALAKAGYIERTSRGYMPTDRYEKEYGGTK